MILHEYAASGNCYKIRLTAAHLGVALDRVQYDILRGETRTPAFLNTINANGRIPVLQDGDRFLPESNAACFYLADGSDLIPDNPFDRADMLRWMFWEQYHHEPNIATIRFWMGWVGEENLSDFQRAQLQPKRDAGDAALALMDHHLAGRSFFVGNRLSLADIALYAYTHVASEGGFDVAQYAAIMRWIDRVASIPSHLLITD